jgi:tetratricopeptide (TPR) repeat protein
MQDSWERGRDVIRESLKLLRAGEKEQALNIIDEALAEAIAKNHKRWASTLCRHAAIIAHSMGDYSRQVHYEEKALPFAEDFKFAAYNFSLLLLQHGQVDRAERFAEQAYTLSVTGTTDTDRDLVAAILKQWPNIARQS